jgi:hypothetical protein
MADLPGHEKPVRVVPVWARPISGRGGEISLLDEKKKEVAFFGSIREAEDAATRAILEEELGERYLIPVIRSIQFIHNASAMRLFDLDTDRGRRKVMIKDPNRDVFSFGEDGMLLRDTLGNRYEIKSVGALDKSSREAAQRLL